MTSKAKTITIAAALSDRKLLGGSLGASWRAWVVILRAAFGMTLDDDALAIFASVAGGRAPPARRVRELWVVAGRRSGKSRMAAAVATYLACFGQHRLAAGERGVVLVIAGSIDQSRNVFGYVRGFLEESPVLRDEVASITRNEITLKSGIVIAVHTNSFRTIRGRTVCGAVFDETAYWRDDTSATPDTEVYRAVLPALATTNGMLVSISTPYRKLGLLHQKHRDHHGVDGDDVLVVQAPTAVLNPTISASVIASQRSADPESASSEWDAEFRSDVSSFLDDEMIERATDRARPLELPPRPGIAYVAFADAAGGSAGGDSYTFGVAHRESELMILDVVRGVSGKFDPLQVTSAYAALAKAYGVDVVRGDSYSAEWVVCAWHAAGVSYAAVEPTKSAVYLEALPVFATGTARLPNHPVLLRELRLLERRVGRGRDVIDHPKGCTDDHALACCGALWLARTSAPGLWSRDSLLVGGEPASLPKYADVIFAVAVSSADGQLAVAYFALGGRNDPPLALVDVEVGPLRSELLLGINARLVDLHAKVPTSGATAIFTSSPVGSELVRLGYTPAVVQTIDQVLADELLAISAATHVGSGQVRLCAEAMTKDFPLTFLTGAPASKDDCLATAVHAGIGVALDQGRKARAA